MEFVKQEKEALSFRNNRQFTSSVDIKTMISGWHGKGAYSNILCYVLQHFHFYIWYFDNFYDIHLTTSQLLWSLGYLCFYAAEPFTIWRPVFFPVYYADKKRCTDNYSSAFSSHCMIILWHLHHLEPFYTFWYWSTLVWEWTTSY